MLLDDASYHILACRYWGGGSVDAAAADAPYCVLRPIGPSYTDRLHDLFEDGTVHFLGIAGKAFFILNCCNNSMISSISSSIRV